MCFSSSSVHEKNIPSLHLVRWSDTQESWATENKHITNAAPTTNDVNGVKTRKALTAMLH